MAAWLNLETTPWVWIVCQQQCYLGTSLLLLLWQLLHWNTAHRQMHAAWQKRHNLNVITTSFVIFYDGVWLHEFSSLSLTAGGHSWNIESDHEQSESKGYLRVVFETWKSATSTVMNSLAHAGCATLLGVNLCFLFVWLSSLHLHVASHLVYHLTSNPSHLSATIRATNPNTDLLIDFKSLTF